VFAQSIGDYASLSSIATWVESMAYSVRWWLGSLSPLTWALVAACLIGLFLWSRR